MKALKSFQYILTCCLCLVLISCTDDTADTPKVTVADAMHKSAKRGVAFKFDYGEDAQLLEPAISWSYNWGNDRPEVDASTIYLDAMKVEFCPMIWNKKFNPDAIRNWVQKHPNTQYLLAFNEPNLKDQANMTPQVAASYWPQVKELAAELNLKIVSPAMNYGTVSGYGDPIKWLDEFFACDGVSLDDVCAISIHCYMANPASVKNYIKLFAKYNKPIWMTEFCAWESYAIHSEEDQMRYMCEVLNHMERNESVQRYAWFIPRQYGDYPYMQLLTNDKPIELTNVGKVFRYFSTFDKSVWLDGLKEVAASNYVEISTDAIQVRPSQRGKHLMLYSFMPEQSVTYQIGLRKAVSSMTIYYSAPYSDAQLLLFDNGALQTIIQFPKTDGFESMQVPVSFSEGQHTLRIDGYAGSVNIDSFIFE